jgi:hypothetical protein
MRIRWNWGTAIALVYGLFALTTMSFVAFAMSKPVDLVSADYYRRSLEQDARQAAVRNAQALGGAVTMETTASGDAVQIQLPAAHAADARGQITLYRPSNTGWDRVIPLALTHAARQDVSLTEAAAGRWMLQIEWTSGGTPFYYEQALTVR